MLKINILLSVEKQSSLLSRVSYGMLCSDDI